MVEPLWRIFQSTAAVCSVLLVGALVLYSVGGVVFLGGSKSNPMFKQVSPTRPEPQPKFLSGSKSTFVFVGTGIKPPVERAPPPHEPVPAIPPAE